MNPVKMTIYIDAAAHTALAAATNGGCADLVNGAAADNPVGITRTVNSVLKRGLASYVPDLDQRIALADSEQKALTDVLWSATDGKSTAISLSTTPDGSPARQYLEKRFASPTIHQVGAPEENAGENPSLEANRLLQELMVHQGVAEDCKAFRRLIAEAVGGVEVAHQGIDENPEHVNHDG